MSSFLLLKPVEKSQQTCDAFEQSGLKALSSPLQKLVPETQTVRVVDSKLAQLPTNSVVVLLSSFAANLMVSQLNTDNCRKDLRYISIGQATAKVLADVGIESIVPKDQRTEGLLTLPDLLQVENVSVLIIKGKNGRQKLATDLAARGAKIEQLDLYERILNPEFEEISHWQKQQISCIIATSGEQIELAFTAMDQPWLQQLPWIVVSPRTAEIAKHKGIKKIIVSQNASDEALITIAKHTFGAANG